MFVSRNVDISHVFCNDYIRIKQPLIITNSRFNSTNHKLDTMNAEQPGNWECFITFICAIVNLSKFSHISLMYISIGQLHIKLVVNIVFHLKHDQEIINIQKSK